MSFGVGVGDIIAVSKLATKIRAEWVGASGQYAEIRNETKALDNVLRDIGEVYQCFSLTDEQHASLLHAGQMCEDVLHDLEAVMKRYSGIQRVGSDLKSRFKRSWVRMNLSSDDTNGLRDRLQTVTLLLANVFGSIERDLMVETNSIIVSLNNIHIDKNWDDIASWVSPDNQVDDQRAAFDQRSPDTGNRFLNSPQYIYWLQTPGSTLLCEGIPGAGKTVLAATIINNLQIRCTSPSSAVLYFYCSYKRRFEQDLTRFLSCIIRQLFQLRNYIDPDVKRLYDQYCKPGSRKRGSRPLMTELRSLLLTLLNRHAECYLVVDALDEYEIQEQKRSQLLQTMFDLQAHPKCKVNVLATMRHDSEIVFRPANSRTAEIRADPEDIARYIQHRVSTLQDCIRDDKELCAKIESQIVSLVDGMFLLAKLHFDSLAQKTNRKQARKALEAMPQGENALESVYGKAIERIEDQPQDIQKIAKDTFTLITYGRRDLTLDEVREALAVDLDDFDGTYAEIEEAKEDEERILNACAGLVVLDPASRIVRLAHQTTQEYLKRVRDRWLPDGESFMSLKCLYYLSIFKDEPPRYPHEDQQMLRSKHFLGYASVYYGYHVRASKSEKIKALCLESFKDERIVKLSYGIRWLPEHRIFRHGSRENLGWWPNSALKDAIYFDLTYVVQYYFESGAGHPRPWFSNALNYTFHAASSGSVDTLNWIVDNYHLNINSQDTQGRTLLFVAAEYRHAHIVEAVLAREQVDVETISGTGDSVLHVAVINGDLNIVKLLLQNSGRLVNMRTAKDESALLLAVISQRKDIVEYLLTYNGIDVNFPDKGGRTPLSVAACLNNITCMESLLAHDDASIELQDRYGQTPLSCATICGSLECMNALIAKRRTVLSIKNHGQQSLLVLASVHGQMEAMKLLLECPEIDINSCDLEGHTSLMLAAAFGHNAAVELLIEHGANPDLINVHKQRAVDIVKFMTDDSQTPRDTRATYAAIHRQLIECEESRGKSAESHDTTTFWDNKSVKEEDVELGVEGVKC